MASKRRSDIGFLADAKMLQHSELGESEDEFSTSVTSASAAISNFKSVPHDDPIAYKFTSHHPAVFAMLRRMIDVSLSVLDLT